VAAAHVQIADAVKGGGARPSVFSTPGDSCSPGFRTDPAEGSAGVPHVGAARRARGRRMMTSSTFEALFGAISVEIEAFAFCEIGEEVALFFPPIRTIEVIHVLKGTLYHSMDDGEPIRVEEGSMLIVPPGRRQLLSATPVAGRNRSAAEIRIPVRDGMAVFDTTEGKPAVLQVACGILLSDIEGTYGALGGLTRPVAADLSDVPVVAAAFEAILEEAAMPHEGSMMLTGALMKACLIVLIRRHLRSSREAGVPPAVMGDMRVSRSIAAVLAKPAASHSVATMAREAGMSRSAFSRHFRETVDVTPMEFVARVRLDHARRLLLATGRSVEAIAATVGFRSRSHFSRLFRERFGVDPSSFRRIGTEPAKRQ
jgi:AraC-like DNA-binding protein